MSDHEVPLILPLSRGWKPAERKTHDAAPVVLLEDPAIGSSDDDFQVPTSPTGIQQSQCCLVCTEHQARYICPRCSLPYCSVKCYKAHTSVGNDKQVSCTEEFYQNRVSSVLDLEAKEQKKTIRQVINRQFNSNLIGRSTEEEYLLEDELVQLLEDLEVRDEKGIGLSQEELLQMMSPALRASFQNDLQSGNVQDLLLKQWHPWWRRKLASNNDSGGNSEKEATLLTNSAKTLDERLLQVPAFRSIYKGSSKPMLQLLFNIVDILYSFVWTQRLYHGTHNLVQNQLVVEAVNILIQDSAVLCHDARHTTLEEALVTCTAASTAALQSRNSVSVSCNTKWDVLVEDTALVMTSHRLVGRALLEISDLLKKAIQELKRRIAPGAAAQSGSEDNATDREALIHLRKIRKKIDFFLSWSQEERAQFGERLQSEIIAWKEQWRGEEKSIEILS